MPRKSGWCPGDVSAQSTSGVASTGKGNSFCRVPRNRACAFWSHTTSRLHSKESGRRSATAQACRLQARRPTARIPDAVVSLRPDVLVLDLNMSGIDAAEVVGGALAPSDLPHRCARTSRACPRLSAAAPDRRRGCLLKSSASGELTRCVHSICSGGVYIDPGIAGVPVVGRA